MGGIKIEIIEYTNDKYPRRLLEINNYPKKLYVEGNSELLNNNSIAIVGSRKCSKYGWEQAMKFGKELSINGICVVSGLAIGIDKAAHIGAKYGWGKTIAVLGGGFNDIYPKENKELFYEIIESGGCIITEYEPDEKTKSTNFPKRNRIISGISMGTLVVEAAKRSGSLITARLTNEQKKPLFCIPSNLGANKGVGTNELIKGGAILTTSVNDIFMKIGLNKRVREKDVRKIIKVESCYRNVYNSLENMPLTVDKISQKCKCAISEVNQALTILKLKGAIKSYPGNQYSLMEDDE